MTKEVLFAYFPGATVKRYQDVVVHFKNLENFWQAEKKDLIPLKWNEITTEKWFNWRENVDEKKLQTELDQHSVVCLPYDDPRYPALLKKIFDPPYALFMRGELDGAQKLLAVVGTRAATRYGYEAVNQLIPKVAEHNIGIVSGLAVGIDTAAHQAALSIKKGTTIAVLGSGVDDANIAPQISLKLAQKIVARGGAIISEYPPGTIPAKHSFASRNRIIAGLCPATLVIEAPEKSGALITASCALDNGREVMTVPHSITLPSGVGTNNLIKNGATIVTKADDILEYFGIKNSSQTTSLVQSLPASLNTVERDIMNLITSEPITSDQLARALAQPVFQLSGHLTQLELQSLIKHIGGTRYIRL